jgi:hypothetical protein
MAIAFTFTWSLSAPLFIPIPSAQTEKSQVSRPDVPPLVRQFKASVNIILRDGQTSETVSTDPLNGHSLRVSTTINVIK